MSQINIEFVGKHDQVWPELAGEVGSIAGIAVLDGGTTTGRPSVAIRIDTDEGSVIAHTTARLFCTAAKMIMAKYPDLFEGE